MSDVQPRKIQKYGWRPGLPDRRSWKYDNHFDSHSFMLPPSVDLRSQDVPIYSQNNLGSCTAHALAGMCQFVTKKLKKKYQFTPSRLFIYYNERLVEGTVDTDSGACLSDGMFVIHKMGVANEAKWPYIESKFTVKPPDHIYANGLQHIVNNYYQIDNTKMAQMKNCLASGFPFVFGFVVYESLESEYVQKTGIVSMPKDKERQIGGHAVMAVGYDDSKQWFIVRNSWGKGWGDGGYLYLPYSYITSSDLAADFWTMRTIS